MHRADALTGLEGDELEAFHRALMKGVAQFTPVIDTPLGRSGDTAAITDELNAELRSVAEELLGPEKGKAYVDELFAGAAEDGRRYLRERQAGKTPLEAARAVTGIDLSDPGDGGVAPGLRE